MIFTETILPGAFVIDIQKLEDHRGFNARAVCQREFEAHRLNSHFVQANVLFNQKKGTLRGFHYQTPPCAETKLFRCVRGGVIDVIIDLRRESPTYKQWYAVELTAENYRMLYVPEHFAHGFQTLEDTTEVTYQVSQFYSPASERGVRYDDPVFQVAWPLQVAVISEKDIAWPYCSP